VLTKEWVLFLSPKKENGSEDHVDVKCIIRNIF